MRLRGRVALVTGGAHRLGRSVVLELASRGADVAIHYNQSAAAALATARCAAGYGARTTIVQADAADEAAVAAMVDQVVADLGPVDILVACAGVFRRTPLADARTRDWQDMMRGNFDTFRNCADKLAPAMAARGRGAIVAFGDVAALRPWADYIPYCTAKARVLAHARTLSRRLAPAVRVNSVLPGPVLFPSDYPAEARHREVERTLLGRAGQPEDVARAVAFLLENDYLTGVELPIDGGRLLV